MIPQARLAVDGPQRLKLGSDFERQVADDIRRRGRHVEKFGQALLSDEVRDVLKRTYSLLRWLPDLIGWHPQKRRPFLIDAKSCIRSSANHAIEMRVLLAARFTDLPVFYVCDDYKVLPSELVWPDGCIKRPCCDGCMEKARADPTGRALPRVCPVHVQRGYKGSGTPYVLVDRRECLPAEQFFGPRLCGSCETPETKWDAAHPLYRDGAAQCPLCSQADAEACEWPPVAAPGSGT